jgi:hypothetical protein
MLWILLGSLLYLLAGFATLILLLSGRTRELPNALAGLATIWCWPLVLPYAAWDFVAVRLAGRPGVTDAPAGDPRPDPPPHWTLEPFDDWAARGKWWALVYLALFAYAIALTAWSWNVGEPFYNNDEPRHLMTGAYWSDLLVERPVTSAVPFSLHYYAHYPAIGPLHWPPFFHAIEGVCFAVVGPSAAVGRALVAIALAVFFCYWWALSRRLIGGTPALLATILVALTPCVWILSHYVMLEVPALACMTAGVMHFHRFLETNRTRHLIAALLASLAAVLIKPQAAALLLVFLGQIAMTSRWGLFRRKDVWLAIAAGALVAGGYYGAVVTLQSTARADLLRGAPHAENVNLIVLAAQALGWPLLGLAVFGLVAGVFMRNRRRRGILYIWVFGAVLVITEAATQPDRFLIFAVPPLVTLGTAVGWTTLNRLPRRWPAWCVFSAGCVALVAARVRYDTPGGLHGYAAAAHLAVRDSCTKRIFFQGRRDGTFIWYVRCADPDLKCAVFRASKLLGAGNIYLDRDFEAQVFSKAQVAECIESLGADLIVTEAAPEGTQPPFTWFLELCDEGAFEPVTTIPVSFDGRPQPPLKVFRVRPHTPGRAVRIPMPTLQHGRSITADLNRPLRGWRRMTRKP